MRIRVLAAAALTLLGPAAMFASPTARESAVSAAATSAFSQPATDDDCGRGNAWGCRRKRGDDRYDNRRDDRRDQGRYERDRSDRDRYDRDRADQGRYDQDRSDRDRYDRDRYDRERYERERYERERYERGRYERKREEGRWRHRDRSYSRYDGYPVACIRAGGRIIGSAVLVICVP